MEKMTGIKYVCKESNITYTDLANELGVQKQNVSSWGNGKRKIPKKHLAKLSQIFGGIPEEYFGKEIDEIDKLNMKKILIESQQEDVEYTYRDINPVTGDEIEKLGSYTTQNNEWYCQALEYEARKKQYIKDLDKFLKIDYKISKCDEENIWDAKNYLKIFEIFFDVICDGIDIDIIKDILYGVRKYQGKEVFEDNLVNDVVKAINNKTNEDEKKRIAEMKWLIENGFYTKEELLNGGQENE